jgi:hypothetical protein
VETVKEDPEPPLPVDQATATLIPAWLHSASKDNVKPPKPAVLELKLK